MKIVYVHILFSIVYSHSHYITISPWSGSIKKRINKQFTGFLLAVMQQEENLQPCTDHFSTIFYRFLFYVFFFINCHYCSFTTPDVENISPKLRRLEVMFEVPIRNIRFGLRVEVQSGGYYIRCKLLVHGTIHRSCPMG